MFAGEKRFDVVLRNKNGMTRSYVSFESFIHCIGIGEWKYKARPNAIEFVVKPTEKINHPSPKPIEAMRKLMHHYCEKDWIVYDPFMGSGTTAIVCEEMGFKWIGSEISPEYCQVIRERLSRHSTQSRLFAYGS